MPFKSPKKTSAALTFVNAAESFMLCLPYADHPLTGLFSIE
jgi:hypothetical protein